MSAAVEHITQAPQREYERARDLVLKYGWNSTSFQIVNPGIKRWFSTDKQAVVGYVTASHVRVVVGAPVCTSEQLERVTAEFEADAGRRREHVCYFGAESRLEAVCSDLSDHTKFMIGAQPMWSPANWPTVVQNHKSFRAQLNRARNKGVAVTEWPSERAGKNAELRLCLARWLDSKGLPPLHFMVESDTLDRLENRRIFVAERGERVVGFVVLSPVANRNGWLFEQFPHVPGAPNGTVELMIDAAMRTIADEGSVYATLGLSPLSRRASVELSPIPSWLHLLLGWLRKHGQRFYNFDGLDAFKAKLRPDTWEPVYAISNEPRVSYRTLYAIAGAFSGNAPVRMVAGGLYRSLVTEIGNIGRVFRRTITK